MKNSWFIMGLAAFATGDVACMSDIDAPYGEERRHSCETLRDAYKHASKCEYPQAVMTLKSLFSGSNRPVDAMSPSEKAFAMGLIADSYYYMKDFEKASSYYYDMLSGGLFHHIGDCYGIDEFCNNLVKPVPEWDYFSKYWIQMNEKVMFLINSSDAYSKTDRKDFAIECLEQLFLGNKEECNREGAKCYADFICGAGVTMAALDSLFKLYDETDQYSRAYRYVFANLDIIKKTLDDCNCSLERSVIFQYFVME